MLKNLLCITACLVLVACSTSNIVSSKNHNKPNILFILVDDLGYNDIKVNNPDTFYETPNIDALAASGMRFTNGYSASHVCSPTRASLLTGQWPTRSGITHFIAVTGGNQPDKWQRKTTLMPAPYTDRLDKNLVTIAELLKDNGYKTFHAGKWHLGPEGWYPEDHGYDINKGGFKSGMPGGRTFFSPYQNPRLTDGEKGEHLPHRLASETIEFMRANKDKPFFASLWFYSVHTPLQTTEKLKKKYQVKRKTLGLKNNWGREGKAKVRLVQEHAVYAGMMESMDQAVGRVINSLEQLGLDENTVVIFSSDNGGLSTSEGHPTSNLPLRAGKGWEYEGGVRVPWIIRYPGVTKEGAVNDQLISSPDFFPTVANIANVKQLPENQIMDGIDLAPLLAGKAVPERPIFWHFPHYSNQFGTPSSSVRLGKWKLIQDLEDNLFELYNLEQDSSESNNLVLQEPEVTNNLKRYLMEFQKQTGARFPGER